MARQEDAVQALMVSAAGDAVPEGPWQEDALESLPAGTGKVVPFSPPRDDMKGAIVLTARGASDKDEPSPQQVRDLEVIMAKLVDVSHRMQRAKEAIPQMDGKIDYALRKRDTFEKIIDNHYRVFRDMVRRNHTSMSQTASVKAAQFLADFQSTLTKLHALVHKGTDQALAGIHAYRERLQRQAQEENHNLSLAIQRFKASHAAGGGNYSSEELDSVSRSMVAKLGSTKELLDSRTFELEHEIGGLEADIGGMRRPLNGSYATNDDLQTLREKMTTTLRKMQRHVDTFHEQMRNELAKGPSAERIAHTWGAILETHQRYVQGLKKRARAMSSNTDDGFHKSLRRVEEKFRKTLSEATTDALKEEAKVERGIGNAQKFLHQINESSRAMNFSNIVDKIALAAAKESRQALDRSGLREESSAIKKRVEEGQNEITKRRSKLSSELADAVQSLSREKQAFQDKLDSTNASLIAELERYVDGTLSRIARAEQEYQSELDARGKKAETVSRASVNDAFVESSELLERVRSLAEVPKSLDFQGCYRRPSGPNPMWAMARGPYEGFLISHVHCAAQCQGLSGAAEDRYAYFGLECPREPPPERAYEPLVTCWCLQGSALEGPEGAALVQSSNCYGHPRPISGEREVEASNGGCDGPYIGEDGSFLGGFRRVAVYRMGTSRV